MKKQDVERLLDNHRKKAVATCSEDCFCWDIDNFLILNDKRRKE